jgi:hypothetical protein
MTPERLAELRSIIKRAGTLLLAGDPTRWLEADIQLLPACRELLAEINRLRAENERLRSDRDRLNWIVMRLEQSHAPEETALELMRIIISGRVGERTYTTIEGAIDAAREGQ